MTSMIGRVVVAALTTALVLGQLAGPAYAQSKCTSSTCGVVHSVQQFEQRAKGRASAWSPVRVVGGVLGHQIGSGRGNTAQPRFSRRRWRLRAATKSKRTPSEPTRGTWLSGWTAA